MKYLQTDVMINIIKKSIIEDRLKTKKERGSYFYASEAYLPGFPDESACARQLAYKVLKYKEDEPREEMYPIFALGDLYHEFIQKIFVKEKLATQVEEFTIMYDDDGKYYWIRRDANKIVVKEPIEIHGRLDLKFEIEHARFISDIKTINERSWKYLDKPKMSHYAQVQLYLHHLKIDKGFILYINKSSGEMKEFLVQYDSEFVQKYLEDFAKLQEHIKTKGLPKRHFENGEEVPWQCKYCGFTKTCLGMSVEDVSKKTYIQIPKEE